jgi:hypothetical protein
MNTIKQHVKDVETQNASYLEKMLDLESTIKTMPTLKSSIEKYKNQVVELETANIEALSSLQIKEQKCRQFQEELESSVHAREFLEQQLEELRGIVHQQERRMEDDEKDEMMELRHGVSAADVLGGGMHLREQVARLERENRQLQEQLQQRGGKHDLSRSGTFPSDASATAMNSMDGGETALAVLRQERDDALRLKQVWQEKALEMKRQHEALLESQRRRRPPLPPPSSSSGDPAASSPLSIAPDQDEHHAIDVIGDRSAQRDVSQLEATNARLAMQLLAHEEQAQKLTHHVEASDSLRATIGELTNRLKEKETMINNLAQDKEKLETYTKKTLHAVQTKYMVAVSSHRNQLTEKQAKVDLLETKLKELKQSQKREQALLMSSFYEVDTHTQRHTRQRDSTVGYHVGSYHVFQRIVYMTYTRTDAEAYLYKHVS